MIQRSSRTTSLLGSSLNSSQLSLYSHASSRSGASRYDGGRAAELTRVSSGGQASKGVGGHGYLTSSRTISVPKGAQSKSKHVKGAISQARERRKQERKRAHTAAEEESLDGDTGVKNDDLESYLMSFGGEKAGPGKATAKGRSKSGYETRKSVLPRGSELDWDNLLESGGLPNGTKSEQDDVFTDMEDPGDLDGSAFLKKPTKMDSPVEQVGEQTRDKLRRISNVSSDIKFLGENSASPSVNDLVLTDSLDTTCSSTSNAHAPMATEQPRYRTIRNLLSESDHSLERNVLKDVMEATNLISSNEIDVYAVHSLERFKPVTMRNREATCNFSDSVTISEEKSISESFDFKQNVLPSIDQLGADVNELHHQSEESSFEQNLHNVHSLRELEEILEDSPIASHSGKDTTQLSTSHGKGDNNLTTKSSTSTKREQSPVHSPQPKPKWSGFKFSASNSTIEDIIVNKQHKVVVSYSSDEFESESVSEVESMADTIKEESVVTHSDSGGELEETVVSGESDIDVEDRTEGRHISGTDDSMEHSELSYSSFSETERKDKSELTESQQQMEQLVPDTSIHRSSTSKELDTSSKPSTMATVGVQRDACVQTEPLAAVSSSQPTFTGYPSVTVGHHYGKEYLDPSPILPHVISPDALEVVTGYSPSVVALTDMLRTQLSITQSLVAHTRQLAATVSSSITPNYHYTTLEETKQYIARHRPKLLSFEEARKLVQSEHQ